MTYKGEVFSKYQVIKAQTSHREEGYETNYIFGLKGGLNIDATKYGNRARFANHSCDANMYPEVVSI